MAENEIEINWTPFALRCLDDIYEYIVLVEKSHQKAQKLIDEIFLRTAQLKRFPESGQAELLLQSIGQNARYLITSNKRISCQVCNHVSKGMVYVIY